MTLTDVGAILVLVAVALVALIVEVKRLHDALRPVLESRIVGALSAA